MDDTKSSCAYLIYAANFEDTRASSSSRHATCPHLTRTTGRTFQLPGRTELVIRSINEYIPATALAIAQNRLVRATVYHPVHRYEHLRNQRRLCTTNIAKEVLVLEALARIARLNYRPLPNDVEITLIESMESEYHPASAQYHYLSASILTTILSYLLRQILQCLSKG